MRRLTRLAFFMAGILALTLAAGALAACGKKGKLERPAGSEPQYPRTYPRG